jgi:hypothetical protein
MLYHKTGPDFPTCLIPMIRELVCMSVENLRTEHGFRGYLRLDFSAEVFFPQFRSTQRQHLSALEKERQPGHRDV